MKRIVVVGGSVAALRAVEHVKDQSPVEITMVFLDDQPPAVREYFPRYLAQAIKPQDVFYRKKDFFERAGITALFNKKIERINFKKCRLTTSEKEQIDYDQLILGDLAGPSFPDIKGKQKTGVFYGDRFNDIKNICDGIGMVDTIAIESDSLSGLRLGFALATRKKEILLLVPSGWAALLDDESRGWLEGVFWGLGIRLLCGEKITEVLGDADVKAIRLKNGKVMASQMVVYTDLPPDVRLLQESELAFRRGVVVNPAGRTSLDPVFAVDGMVDPVGDGLFESAVTLYDMERQGDALAAALLGQTLPVAPGEIPLRQFESEGVAVDVAGDIRLRDGVSCLKYFGKEDKVFCAACLQDGVMVGGLLINYRKNLDKFLRFIKEKVNLTGKEETIFAIDGSRAP